MNEQQWVLRLKNATLKKWLRPLAIPFFNVASWLENKFWAKTQLHYSPIFVVAPPRSGTTLFYQLMTTCLATSYFTNLAVRFGIQGSSVSPLWGALLIRLLNLHSHNKVSFENYYGATQGWAGPHEGNIIWEQWFPQDVHYIAPGTLSLPVRQCVYRSIAGTERIFNRPFVNKRIRNSVRIEALAEIFPTALFIQCKRNPLDIAQSIFIARTRDFPFQEGKKDGALWWNTVKPRAYPSLKDKSLVEQICGQVYYVEHDIAVARQVVGNERFLTIEYEQLCQSPREEMARVVTFMNTHNAPTHIVSDIPETFPYSTGCKISPDDYALLADGVRLLYGGEYETAT